MIVFEEFFKKGNWKWSQIEPKNSRPSLKNKKIVIITVHEININLNSLEQKIYCIKYTRLDHTKLDQDDQEANFSDKLLHYKRT